VVKGMNKAIKDGSMHMTDAVDGKSVTMTHLKPC
jgi:hypothetical protein